MTKKITLKKFEPLVVPLPSDNLNDNPLAMDGTPHFEISMTDNLKYSEEIMGHANDTVNLKHLQDLKEVDIEEYKNEASNQIKDIFLDYERLQAHHNRDRVNLLIKMGVIIIDIESTLGRSEAAKLIKDKFKDMHRRYFQQAKFLARNEAIARKYASLAKNRLLELIRLLKATDKTIEELLKDYPFPDTVKDEKGFLFTKHIDSIINLFRLRAADIEFATIDDAKRIAAFRTKAIEVNRAVQIKEKLDELGSGGAQQKEIFEEYLKNSLHFPQDSDSQNTVAPPDMNQILANVIKYYDPDKFEDDNWVAHQKEIVDEDIIVNAYRIIILIARKLEIQIPTI